jgi:type IV pilus assembly protein PilA
MLSRLTKDRQSSEEGFTLVEILVVVALVGILTAIVVPIYLNQQKAAIARSVKSDVRSTAATVATALNYNPVVSNMAAEVPVADRAKSSTGTVINIGTSIAATTTRVTGNGTWAAYVIVGYDTNLGSNATHYYYYNSVSGKYVGAGDLS